MASDPTTTAGDLRQTQRSCDAAGRTLLSTG